MTTQEFFAELPNCNLCKEYVFAHKDPQARSEPVPAVGSFTSRIALIGRNPGRTEAHKGIPFCGAAGNKLDKTFAAVGLKRSDCYITNTVKCFTPSGVSPSISCRRRCTGRWLDRELAQLQNLELIIAFGNEALQYFEPEAIISQLHGTAFPIQHRKKVTLFVMFHPAACFYNPRIQARYDKDTAELKKLLKEMNLS